MSDQRQSRISMTGSQFQPLGLVPPNWLSLESRFLQQEQSTNAGRISDYGQKFESHILTKWAICSYIDKELYDQLPRSPLTKWAICSYIDKELYDQRQIL